MLKNLTSHVPHVVDRFAERDSSWVNQRILRHRGAAKMPTVSLANGSIRTCPAAFPVRGKSEGMDLSRGRCSGPPLLCASAADGGARCKWQTGRCDCARGQSGALVLEFAVSLIIND